MKVQQKEKKSIATEKKNRASIYFRFLMVSFVEYQSETALMCLKFI